MQQDYSIAEINEKYELELERVLEEIKIAVKGKEGIVLLQFADGLKPFAIRIVDYLKEQLKVENKKNKIEFLIWFGTCFGACDFPVLDKELENKIDFVVQFGHNSLMPRY